MKFNIIVDPAGNIVGSVRASIAEKGKGKAPDFEAGMDPSQGQTIYEVDIPEELAQLEGPELLRRLSEVDSVKQALSTISTAGQASSYSAR
jgi:hypothetical protein